LDFFEAIILCLFFLCFFFLLPFQLLRLIRKPDEWDKLAAWVVDHRLASPNVRWMVQIPRLYAAYKSVGDIKCFSDMIDSTTSLSH
jgi:adenosine deaminase